jgi:hypothetical protein
MKGRFKLPSPGVVIGTIALVFAMGGAAYAGQSVGKTVGTGELKQGAVTAPKLHADAVRTNKIADNAVKGSKVAEDTLGTVPSAVDAISVLSAVVQNNGTLLRSQQDGTSSSRSGQGVYIVAFPFDVGTCAYVASLGGGGGEPRGFVSTSLSAGNTVQVQTFNTSGNAADRSFSLVVNCGTATS